MRERKKALKREGEKDIREIEIHEKQRGREKDMRKRERIREKEIKR